MLVLHAARVVAVNAGDRVDAVGGLGDQVVGVPVGHLRNALEALPHLLGRDAVRQGLLAELAVERHDRRVAKTNDSHEATFREASREARGARGVVPREAVWYGVAPT
jgi:hypothetical protein